jgi:hypothetical protein
MRIRHRLRTARAPLAWLVLAACAPCVAGAVDFPVSGTIVVNANPPAALPDGGSFAGSGYDAASGAIASGRFVFPQSTTTFHSDALGADVTITYQLSQTNTSSGQVASDGVAALTAVAMKLQILAASVGVIPIGVGTCIFQPIDIGLSGVGAAAGLDLTDPGFTIPPVGPTDCGSFGSQINSGIAGSDNSLQTHFGGNFTPPPAQSDTIFSDGFDPPGA